MAKNYPELQKICTLVKLQCGVKMKDLTWIKDTAYKIAACYLAFRLTKYKDWEIAAFFNINPYYMKQEVEAYSIGVLVDSESKQYMIEVEAAFKELEQIHA